MQSTSNHHEFNHSCHWLISQLNHLNFTKNQSLKKTKEFWGGGMATSPNHSSVASGSRRLKSKLSPLRISGSTTVARGWEGQTDPWPPGRLFLQYSRWSSHSSHCIRHHLGLPLPVTNLYTNYWAPRTFATLPIAPFGSTGVPPCICLFPGARESREWRLHIPDSREWKNRPGNAFPSRYARRSILLNLGLREITPQRLEMSIKLISNESTESHITTVLHKNV